VLNSAAGYYDRPFVYLKVLVFGDNHAAARFSTVVENSCATLGIRLWILWITSRRESRAGEALYPL
jgi:hypothetical protein